MAFNDVTFQGYISIRRKNAKQFKMTSDQHLSASMRRATVFSYRRNEKFAPWNFFQCAALFVDENLRGKNNFLKYFSSNI
jgi:hypothetical protein